MKTKLLVFVSLIALNFCVGEIQASNTTFEKIPIYENDNGDPPAGYEKIILLGDLMLNSGPNSIVAGVSDNAIYIGFNQNLGNMNISVYNGMGNLVYSTVINTAVQSVVIIPFIAPAPDN